MAIFRSSLFVLLCLGGSCARGQNIDWPKVHAETLHHFQQLIRIDTRNPPGNETKAAKYVQSVLEREGIPARLFALEPDRANLVARIRGDGSRRPILIMAHTDVVGVQRNRWTVDPFAATRKDGYIWGRGATDDKDNVAAGIALMLLLKRTGVKLSRDVIFLAEAGEEGSSRVGIDFMIDQHWNEIAAEFAIAEGGYIAARRGQVRYVAVSTTEKVPRGVRLVARGTAGHGSRPIPDNAVARIATAVARISSWQPPLRLNDTTRTYFERLATVSPPDEARRYNHILNPALSAEIERYFWENEPGHYSILRTSIAPTMINAGFRTNVIPSEAEAYLDIRALPDEDMPSLLEQLRRVIGDENVDIRMASGGRPPAPPSRIDTDMFRALEKAQAKLFPGAITLPTMLTGATDLAQLRAKGVQGYGLGPTVELTDGGTGGAHGDDERLAVSSLASFTEYLWHVVLDVAR
jgi:acetylornithine deacetylase/succinyl-diaminopimelate desuccinylase-like protein